VYFFRRLSGGRSVRFNPVRPTGNRSGIHSNFSADFSPKLTLRLPVLRNRTREAPKINADISSKLRLDLSGSFR
jgi:hypothetical protein